GDRIADRPLNDVGGKGLFTKELEQALLAGEIDFAVHSYKDVPVTMPLVEQGNLVVAAVPAREDVGDVLVSLKAKRLEDLPQGARLGTSSLRRRCQALSVRPDLTVLPVRGNIDTRLRKLRDGEYDAILLAAAGLRRAGLFDGSHMSFMDLDAMLPAPGQGALALQCRRDDVTTRSLLVALDDERTSECVAVERAVVSALQGDCHSPIAALAVALTSLHLRVVVGGRDGRPPVLRAEGSFPRLQPYPEKGVEKVVSELESQGVRELLHGR
ncbi:MAG TPA: hydroxymethylbilane synthase, partial [Tepidisphaeraceae bacterium]|nr:hydroxymethylbilane synthase [Tepidisphaeraceae bacterium]